MKQDLSVKKYAEQSKNVTARIGIYIMNAVLALAYAIELLKGARTPDSYAIVAVLCILPCVVAQLIYMKDKTAQSIRYVLGVGFLILYTYVMFTTTSELPFCYVIVAFVILMVYVDVKLLSLMGGCALLINAGVLGYKAMTRGLTAAEITDAEIIFACLCLTGLFIIMALKKIGQINEANIEKAEREKEQSQALLTTTLSVAATMTESIDSVVTETEHLKEAIGQTSSAMSDLSSGANDAAEATEEQAAATEHIGIYMKQVEGSVNGIMKESREAQENLESGSKVMEELLQQVKTSETSGKLVTEKVTGLKEYADRMQEIMGLISNVAKKTGLLALNASIEAARAGEAGRGFGVVASEISSLSEQTNAATEDITELIRNIVTSIDEAAEAMDRLLESSSQQNEFIGASAENFEKIHESTGEIIKEAVELKKVVDVVSGETRQIEEKIGNVSSITQEVTARSEETLEACNMNLESIEEVAAIMENLKEEAKKLQKEA